MNQLISAEDMITRVFRNLDSETIEKAGKISAIWSKVVRGIKNTRDEFYGDKIASHSEVVEFKNGQLLVEADHPGWIQAIQLHSKFIIRGMNMNMKDFKVDSIVFRLKGNQTVLFNSYENELEKARKDMEKHDLEAEKKTEEFLKKSRAFGAESDLQKSTEAPVKEELPADFLARLQSLESTVLTNSKDK